jgi:hypothetical protein
VPVFRQSDSARRVGRGRLGRTTPSSRCGCPAGAEREVALPCWVSRSIMSSDRLRYSAACWRVTSLGPGGAQDGESCVRAAGRVGGTRTCVRAGSRLSPELSPLGFVRGRPGVWILVPVDEELPTHEADADVFGGTGRRKEDPSTWGMSRPYEPASRTDGESAPIDLARSS